LLSVTIGLSNQGVILLGVTEALLRIQQVSPVPDEMRGSIEQQPGPVESEDLELPWPVVGEKTRHWPKGEFEIEPGEADEVRFDFVIDGPVDTLRVYSYIRNVKKRGREIGWQLTTTYNLGTNEPNERTVEKLSGKERR